MVFADCGEVFLGAMGIVHVAAGKMHIVAVDLCRPRRKDLARKHADLNQPLARRLQRLLPGGGGAWILRRMGEVILPHPEDFREKRMLEVELKIGIVKEKVVCHGVSGLKV